MVRSVWSFAVLALACFLLWGRSRGTGQYDECLGLLASAVIGLHLAGLAGSVQLFIWTTGLAVHFTVAGASAAAISVAEEGSA